MIAPLLRLEFAHLARRPLTWIVLGLLAAAMLAGSAVGVARTRAQAETIARVEAEARAAVASVKAASRRYAVPSDIVIPVFRDPTDAYSYMYNFLQTYAVKRPAPLAAVAAGQSDLQPSYIRINMQSVFPDTGYELRSPRILALGSFDLGFVLVYLLPLAIIALGGATLVREQDSTVLRMIAAQPIGPRRVAAAKYGALAILVAPTTAAGAILSLALTGGIGAGSDVAGPALLAAAVFIYALFWVALCALVATLWRGAVRSLALLVLAWAALTVVVPAIASLVLSIAWPAPSRIAYIDASRALADRVPDSYEWEAGASRWLAARPYLASPPLGAERSAEVGRMAHDAFFRAELAPHRDAFADHAAAVARAGDAFRLLSPASALDGDLQVLAGTDVRSQLAFAVEADRYALALRRHFEPLILANIGRERPCASCPGRLNFAGYDAVPAFRAGSDTGAGTRPVGSIVLYLLGVTLVVGWWAQHRFRRWPV